MVACQQLSAVLSHRPPAFHADEAQVPAGRHGNVRRHLEGLQHAFDKRPPEHNGHDHEGEVGNSTNGHKVIDWLFKEQRVMDKVMLFTDMQLWDCCWYGDCLTNSWDEYKRIASDANYTEMLKKIPTFSIV